MEPKNIDRLFQEKLKDLELAPNPAVWNKIEASLVQKKKKKRVAIWFRFASAAAVALLGLFLYNNDSDNSNIKFEPIENTITDTNPIETKSILKEKPNSEVFIEEKIDKQSIIVDTNINIPSSQLNSAQKNKIEKTINTVVSEDKKTNSISNANKELIAEETKTVFEELNTPTTVYDDETIAFTKKSKPLKVENKIDLATVIEDEIEEEVKLNSWVIAPTISQLFSNTMSNKSSIDAKFNNAPKKGENSTSFGFKVAYRGSKKWQFQTGIHKLELAQTTQDIKLSSTVGASSVSNSTFDSKVSEALSSDLNFDPNDPQELRNNEEGTINQTYGYIEIPLEAKYAVLQSKKLEFHLIGGMSTLFLTKNNLQVASESFSYSAGEANNLNKVNFTLNFGSNLEYHFNQKWFFDIAPMIKFQTNTFETRSNKPYFFGIYTGFNYKF